MSVIGELLDGADVVIAAGSGGVGKTTTAAALGLAAAHRGRRVVVVTIDPAKRLAEALGLGAEGLGDAPTRLEGPWAGELWAAMLDTRATFDGIVTRHADPDQAERILSNRFYRNIASALSGTQEYMAAEKLHELAGDPRFDLVVVDTPPSRNALDFIDAPTTLTRFLDHRLYRMLMVPNTRVSKAIGVATSAFVRTVSKVVGGAVVEDAIAFFQSFEGLEEGFRQRAREVAARFRDERTAMVLVTSPRRDTLDEARWLADRLAGEELQVRAVVVNRVQPGADADAPLDRLRQLAADHEGTELATRSRLALQQAETGRLERSQLDDALDGVAPTGARVLVPILDTDVHDLDGLGRIAELLLTP
jgi:anion-transporting  ArsA/GET3 family ATPase